MTPEQLLEAHAILQVGGFLDGVTATRGGLKYAYSHSIGDVFWNYAYGLNHSPSDTKSIVQDIRRTASEYRRSPAVYLLPEHQLSNLGEYVVPGGVIDDAWMMLDRNVDVPDPINIKKTTRIVASSNDMDQFLNVFVDAYGPEQGTSSDVGYTGLPIEYPEAIRKGAPKAPVKVTHFLQVGSDGPSAIASIYMNPPIT